MVCYVFDEDKDVPWKPKPGGKPGEKMQDFWEYSKKKVLNSKLTQRLKDFSLEAIRKMAKIEKVKEFSATEEFNIEKLKNSSSAAMNIAKWVIASVKTYDALKIVDPKEKELKEA